MMKILDRSAFLIHPVSEQWDKHQTQLESVTGQLNEMMREFRRPFDLQNEVRFADTIDTSMIDSVSCSIRKN